MQRYHRWLQLSAFSGVRWNRQYGIIKKQAGKLAGVAGLQNKFYILRTDTVEKRIKPLTSL